MGTTTNTAMATPTNSYGLLARFKTAPDIYHAAEAVRDAGFSKWDVYTPFPVHGMDAAMGLQRSRVPIFTMLGGFVGFFTGTLVVWYMNAFNYPLVVAGMPYFSLIFPFPVMYEMTILFAAFGTLGGMFFINRLPEPYHPVMNYDKWKVLTDDQFAVVIEASDPKYHPERTRALLEELGADDIVELPE